MTALSAGALTIIAFVTVGIGVATWVKTKGKIGQSVLATLGGAFLSTLLVYPQFITAQIPQLFKKAMDWLLSVF
jgi:hypothetical protein